MNCKPGDLAIVVVADNDPEHLGKIVRVTVWQSDQYGGGWNTSPVLRTKQGWSLGWHDDDLRPIRDPGDDAVDETLRDREAA